LHIPPDTPGNRRSFAADDTGKPIAVIAARAAPFSRAIRRQLNGDAGQSAQIAIGSDRASRLYLSIRTVNRTEIANLSQMSAQLHQDD